MNICVFGGSGFIGNRLCNRLSMKDGYNFLVIDKSESLAHPLNYIFCDIRHNIKLDSVPSESVFINLAAEHRDDVRPITLYDETNVEGAKNICNLARAKAVKKIIFTSSVAVYGFAPLGTDENGKISPFNDYGRTKWLAEEVYREWQAEDPHNRTLVIVRPTVVFGEGNRGNVYNLLKQIASRRFVMIGDGTNRKSMAYVENVAAFLEYSLKFKPGIHIYNYTDKPDFMMHQLVGHVKSLLGQSSEIRLKAPYFLGLFIGRLFDFTAFISGGKFSISTIRVKKFCANSVYATAINSTGFVPPVNFDDAIESTVKFEFSNNLDR